MKYLVLEIQVNTDGTVGTLIDSADTYNAARSIWHQKLAYAAISTLPRHTVVILSEDGITYGQESYVHEQEPVVEEPVEEEEVITDG